MGEPRRSSTEAGAELDDDDASSELTSSPCCDAPLTFEPSVVGMTCGGLWLKGWNRCAKCQKCWLSRDGRPCDALTWTVTSSGRAVDIGNGRIRCRVNGETNEEALDVVGLMARIARLPELERELAELKARAAAEEEETHG